jgi:D-alanyl-D-alanine carboxypeptidase/D-alanyl-D-alanine-endopeptidase (penicillin-binding protein 4)
VAAEGIQYQGGFHPAGRGDGLKGFSLNRPLIALCWLMGFLVLARSAQGDLESLSQQQINGAGLGGTPVAVLLMDLSADDVLVEIQADRPMIPASNQKIITTAAALDRLGVNYQFTTRLAIVNDAPAQELPPVMNAGTQPAESDTNPEPLSPQPQLLIIGDGDPALADPILLAAQNLTPDDVLDLWVQHVVDTGHRRFSRLIVDDRIFDRQFVHPSWPSDQLNRDYCSQVAGLNFNNNCLRVLPVPAESAGFAPTVQVYPFWPQLQTINRAVTGTDDAFGITRDPAANVFTFRGKVRNRRSEPFATPLYDPPMVLGQLLAHRLDKAGVTVDEVVRLDDQAPQPTHAVLHEVRTTLASVLDRTNQDSENLFAECLFKRLGHQLTGAPGSFDSGAAAIRIFLQQRMGSRLNTALAIPSDGSGLSRDNQVTARLLVEVLRYIQRDRALDAVFRPSLAEAGSSGTLARRLGGLNAEIFAKSGYIRSVSTLSGYMVYPPADGRRRERVYAFSLLFNNFPGNISPAQIKDTQDRLLRLFDEHLTAQLNP